MALTRKKLELVLIIVPRSFWALQDRQSGFFLQKRLQLSVQKAEQVIRENAVELRNEL
jgi:hypothetical protein